MSCFVLGFSRRPRVSSFQPLRREQVRPHHRTAVPQHNGFTQGSSANRVCQRKSRHGKTATNVSAIFSCYKMLSVMPSCVNTKRCCSIILRVRYSSCCGFQPVECPVWCRGEHPSFPLIYLLPHLFPLLLFSFSHWLYLFSSFVHPFPFYQNSLTPFPGRRS